MENKAPKIVEEIVAVIRSGAEKKQLLQRLDDYHANDIAQSLSYLSQTERLSLYAVLGVEWVSEILAYVEEPEPYARELGTEKLAAIINEMDADDAVDLLQKLDEADKEKLRPYLDEHVRADLQLIASYDEDRIGSLITTNYICIPKTLDIRAAMHELIRQAGEHDNISTLYVMDESGKFSGAIDLKDLIIARQNDSLDALIIYSYPYLFADEKISDCIEKIKDYAEDSLPVLNQSRQIIGIITAQDVVEAVDDEMGEDYAKLAGLTAEEDLNETTGQSIKKRLPWLMILLVLGMLVSSVVGAFRGRGCHFAHCDLFSVPGAGYGRQCGHPVPGRDHSCADGRGTGRQGKKKVGGKGKQSGDVQRIAFGRLGRGFSGGVCALV